MNGIEKEDGKGEKYYVERRISERYKRLCGGRLRGEK